ncbi:TonB-dependent hemoglobin/transferrin/lactoferrin family receptor [Aeromonas rivipollensis]|uniref:TonB-dependent hemoglobin/transferrin/lactoferrin family receptor n=1 Tax=Aeromonas rivipollensis TaxID=948519 RepID=UPI00259E48DD|nr:TonB-dependent hemoglobin/transferrin/lactoferrin family receptor [Aeromonas rivipollensis]MDM5086667.1 TonB-dependent hemoglobin/transferrin/lactoferrin family receptor [Aeromonas rivipollensis]MDM5098651.1 TonB-dependent hemoglobin/transferrin/lactoferrin family receptor [Aeromonas rivipollensis]MDM5107077.1 TonB-dependent hemoglobin/transferrin/lactoferrin family receptor [Aeromonas rivipollensis]
MKTLLHYWPMLLSGTALAASDPAGTVPEPRAHETIVVKGQRIEQKLSDVSGSITVITEEELDRQVATELTDVFKNEPGVSVTGSAGRPQNIIIRGMGGNRVLIIKDGVRVSDGFGADDLNDKVGRFSFDLDDVKQIEVAKGAGSSLHGSDAIGGTIVISTKQPEDYLQGQDAYLGSKVLQDGSSDKQKLSATGAARVLDSEHLLRVSGWQGHETANYDESRIPADLDGLSASTSSRFPLSDHHLLRLELDYFEDNAQRDQGPREVPQPDGKWQVRQYHEQGSQRTQGGKLGWEASDLGSLLADQFTWSLYGNHSKNSANKRSLLQNDLLSGYPRYRSERELSTFTEDRVGSELDVRRDLVTGDLAHKLSYGVELERTRHERPVEKLSLEAGVPQPSQSEPFSSARTDRAGVWLGDVATLGRWQFTPTLRMDHQWLRPQDGNQGENHSWHLSPSLATSYRVNEQWRSWLSYANGFRAPSYDKVYGNIPHYFALPPFQIIANTDLKEETSHSFEWGLSGEGESWSIKPALFYNRYYNFIDWREVGLRLSDGVILRQYRNVAKAETWGAEIAASYWLTQEWELATKLGWVDGEDSQGEALRTLTPLEGNTRLSYQTHDWSLGVQADYAAAMDRVPSCGNSLTKRQDACLASAGWFSLAMTADWLITDALKVNLKLDNLFDTRYTRYQDVAGLEAGTDAGLFTQSGRTFSASLRYTFVGI